MTDAPRREGGIADLDRRLARAGLRSRQRCPQCRKGALFRSRFGFALNERCPVCGLKFDRGNGYFTGAWALNLVLAESVATALWLPLAVDRSIPVDRVTAIGIARLGRPADPRLPAQPGLWLASTACSTRSRDALSGAKPGGNIVRATEPT